MVQNLKPYQNYKDSGVPWLGDVPEHWKVRKQRQVVKLLVSNVDKHSFENEKAVRLCNYVDVYKHDRITERLHFMKATATEDEIDRFRLREGDVLVTKDSESWNDIGVPALVEYAADDLICGYHLAILRPHLEQIIGAYLLRAIQSQGVASQYYVSANGVTRYGLTHQGIKNVQIPIPPLPEQHAIARFLDHIDGRINRTIRAKRKLIALLNEQKQAIIHRAVTRGLDPDAPLRPSGVEWLGVIPAHWDVRRTKYVLREVDERSKTGEETHLSMSQRFGLIPSSNIEERRLLSESYIGAKICRENDLVLNRLKAHLGVFALAKQDGLVSPDYTVLRPMADASVRYFEMVLRAPACRGELRKRAKGIVQGFWRLYTDDFYDICVPFPPQPEQDLIVRRVDEELQVVEAAINRAYREMDLIREYRTRLIADVVTGKFDVRAAAAALPEKLEEIEPEAAEDEEGDLDPEPDGQWEEETDAP